MNSFVIYLGQELRNSLHRINENGINDRKMRRLKRRMYSIVGPNILWHFDTNHKLIRWHFIIAGGIDGFSRLVTFLRCEDHNKADTYGVHSLPKLHSPTFYPIMRY